MCDFSGASYRLGSVLETRDTSTGQRLVISSSANARRVGRAIAGRGMTYLAAVIGTLRDLIAAEEPHSILPYGTDLADTVRFSRDDVETHEYHRISARFAPGMILDFPLILVDGPVCRFGIRLCLTICMHDMNSKIWTRFVTETSKDTPHLTEEQLHDLNRFARGLSEQVHERVRALYAVDICQGYPAQTAISLDTLGQIELFAADCTDKEMAGILNDKYTELLRAGGRTKRIGGTELTDALRVVTSIGLPETAGDQSRENPAEFGVADDVDVIPLEFEADDGWARALMLSYVSGRRAYYAGLVDSYNTTSSTSGSTEAGDEKFFAMRSIAATGEISTSVGAEF